MCVLKLMDSNQSEFINFATYVEYGMNLPRQQQQPAATATFVVHRRRLDLCDRTRTFFFIPLHNANCKSCRMSKL